MIRERIKRKIQRQRLNKPSKMTPTYQEEVWSYSAKSRTCNRCGGDLMYIEQDEALNCLMCGMIMYRQFPKRDADYELCPMCNSYFLPTKEKRNVGGVCDECEIKRKSRVVRHRRTKKEVKKKMERVRINIVGLVYRVRLQSR